MSALGHALRFNRHIEKVRAVTHTKHTHTSTVNEDMFQTHIYSQSHKLGEAACARRNSEACQIRREVCALSACGVRRTHTHMETHTQFGQLPKVLGAGNFYLFIYIFIACSYFLCLHTHKHTHRQGHWCIMLFWHLYRFSLVAVLLAKDVFSFSL